MRRKKPPRSFPECAVRRGVDASGGNPFPVLPGVKHVVSLHLSLHCQPHRVEGIENRIKRLAPDLQLLSLDFDSGVSDVNITNRLLLFINNLKQ